MWKGCGGEGIDNYQYFTSFSGRAWLSPQNSGPRIANTLSFVPLSIVQQGQNIQARLSSLRAVQGKLAEQGSSSNCM